jgi:hypothetical protein
MIPYKSFSSCKYSLFSISEYANLPSTASLIITELFASFFNANFLILIVLSNIFDLNYKTSHSLILEKEYITKIVNSLIYEDKKIEKFFKQIELVLINYIKKKIS